MSIVGTLLPEQLSYFSQEQRLDRTLDWFDDYVQPYHLYVDGEHIQGFYPEKGRDYLSEHAGHRIVVLDALGQVFFNNEEKPLTPGQFHLVYVIQSRDCVGLWDFFQDARSDLVNEDDSSISCLAISVSALVATIFEIEDFFVSSEPPTSSVLEDKLREYILNLQQIARLYPLLEIKLYRD